MDVPEDARQVPRAAQREGLATHGVDYAIVASDHAEDRDHGEGNDVRQVRWSWPALAVDPWQGIQVGSVAGLLVIPTRGHRKKPRQDDQHDDVWSKNSSPS